MNAQEQEAYMTKLMAEINKNMSEYWVTQGQQVTIQSDGKFVVSKILMQGEITKSLSDKKIWGLFCLVGVTSGSIYAEPVPVMSEGCVDLRKLVAPHVTLTYRKTRGNTRFYDAIMVRDGYEFTIVVDGLFSN